ncbi:MAG TPA: STAS domain-containing protein [bacterium]|nr:MAG: STAS domain protein [bacterium ADurb.Bin236]HPI78043.1 STAS domain-containing protein [bacterium]HPN95569.1 STAS domain-containing protein [bacterium]
MKLTVDSAMIDNNNMIKLTGEMVGEYLEALIFAIDEVKSGNNLPVIIDMAGLTFIDSKGAAFLLNVKQKFNDRKIALAAVPADVRNTLARLHIDEQYRIFSNKEEALMRI